MYYSISVLASAWLCATIVQATPYAPSGFTQSLVPFAVFDGSSTAEETSVKDGLDKPKMTPYVNGTAFDWWYFDAVSTSSRNESVTFVFQNFGQDALDVPSYGGPLAIQVMGSFANGTTFFKMAYASEAATFQSSNMGMVSEWKGSGASFAGTSLQLPAPKYSVTFNSPDIGVFGKMTLTSVSPPHYPCDLNRPGVSEEIIPGVYWANALPDADATVNFTIDGETLHFTGLGYHDKNWGTTPLKNGEAMKTWYWGHGRLGPYSVVWFDTLTQDGKEHFSSWITIDGKVVSQSCLQNAIVVRPWGANDNYPPLADGSIPSGYALRYDIGHGKTFSANFTVEAHIFGTPIYNRQIGSIVGGIEGDKQYEGRALCEQFQY